MLFNKHSETKQRFGIRKLTIGVSSVLLSTLFLTVNNGQKVNAATGDTVTNADSNKTDASTNGSAKADDTKVTEDKPSDSSSDQKLTEDKTANNEKQNQQQDKTATDAKSSDTSEKSEKAATTANNKLAKAAVNKFAAKAAVNKFAAKAEVGAMENEEVDYTYDGSARTGSNAAFPVASTSGLSDDGLVATDDHGVTLSMSKNTLGEGGQLGKSGITVKLSGTVNAGDIYTIQVPDFGWGYNPLDDSTITAAGALGNFATAKKTKVVIDGQNYANYQITFKQGITIDNKGFQIVLG